MKKEPKYQQRINYENESVNLRKECCNYLLENDYFNNDKITNINLMENYLIDFSIIKLAEWNYDIENIDIKKLNNLESICEIVNLNIPTENDRYSYFILYVHCIVFLLGEINKQKEIKLKEEKIDKNIIIENKNNIIETITINNETPIYKIPSLLIEEIKNIYKEKKVPVLKK